MAFHDVLAALRARWFLVAGALLCAAVAGAFVLHPKPLYQATAAVVLVPPKAPTTPNTLASATPSIAAAGQAVDFILLSPAETAALRAQGVVDTYTIVPRNNGTTETPAYRVPSEQITVTGGDSTVVLSETSILMADYAARLRSMQAQTGVVVKAQITVGVLAPPTVVQLHGSRSRGALGVGLLGLGAGVALAVRFRPGRVNPDRGGGEDPIEPERAEGTDAVIV